jgi:hypothetical protein
MVEVSANAKKKIHLALPDDTYSKVKSTPGRKETHKYLRLVIVEIE